MNKVSNPKTIRRITQLLTAQGNKCSLCGEHLLFEDANLDHDVPKAKKGKNKNNLKATHRHCNLLKGAMTIDFKKIPKELEADKEKNYNPFLKFRRSVVYHLVKSKFKLKEIRQIMNLSKKTLNKTLYGMVKDDLICEKGGQFTNSLNRSKIDKRKKPMNASQYISFVTVNSITGHNANLGPNNGEFKTYEEAEAAIVAEIVSNNCSDVFSIRKQYGCPTKK